MKRILSLGLCLASLASNAGWAQDTVPVPPPVDIFPETFPTVTPLPPKQPAPTPTPEATPTPVPTITPTAVPTLSPTPRPTSSPSPQTGARQLEFQFGQAVEGQPVSLRLSIKGDTRGLTFPLKGSISFSDQPYDYSKTIERKINFELKSPQAQSLSFIPHTAGKKTIRLQAPGLPTRNALIYVKPLPASVFPRAIDTSEFSRDPDVWQVWVNLHHAQGAQPQRQYYMVVYKDQVLQKLLTSSATNGKITPLGKFKLGPKAASPKSTIYESVMPFWTTILVPGYSFEYGNHGLTGEAYLYLLGVPASHGCLRLSNKWVKQDGEWLNIGGAKWVFNNVPVGTPIQIFRKAVQPFAFENYQMWVKNH